MRCLAISTDVPTAEQTYSALIPSPATVVLPHHDGDDERAPLEAAHCSTQGKPGRKEISFSESEPMKVAGRQRPAPLWKQMLFPQPHTASSSVTAEAAAAAIAEATEPTVAVALQAARPIAASAVVRSALPELPLQAGGLDEQRAAAQHQQQMVAAVREAVAQQLEMDLPAPCCPSMCSYFSVPCRQRRFVEGPARHATLDLDKQSSFKVPQDREPGPVTGSTTSVAAAEASASGASSSGQAGGESSIAAAAAAAGGGGGVPRSSPPRSSLSVLQKEHVSLASMLATQTSITSGQLHLLRSQPDSPAVSSPVASSPAAAGPTAAASDRTQLSLSLTQHLVSVCEQQIEKRAKREYESIDINRTVAFDSSGSGDPLLLQSSHGQSAQRERAEGTASAAAAAAVTPSVASLVTGTSKDHIMQHMPLTHFRALQQMQHTVAAAGRSQLELIGGRMPSVGDVAVAGSPLPSPAEGEGAPGSCTMAVPVQQRQDTGGGYQSELQWRLRCALLHQNELRGRAGRRARGALQVNPAGSSRVTAGSPESQERHQQQEDEGERKSCRAEMTSEIVVTPCEMGNSIFTALEGGGDGGKRGDEGVDGDVVAMHAYSSHQIEGGTAQATLSSMSVSGASDTSTTALKTSALPPSAIITTQPLALLLLGARGGGTVVAPLLAGAHFAMSMGIKQQGKQVTTSGADGGSDMLMLQADPQRNGQLCESQTTSWPQGIDSEASMPAAFAFHQYSPAEGKQLGSFAAITSAPRCSPCIDTTQAHQVGDSTPVQDDCGQGKAEGDSDVEIGDEYSVDLCLRL